MAELTAEDEGSGDTHVAEELRASVVSYRNRVRDTPSIEEAGLRPRGKLTYWFEREEVRALGYVRSRSLIIINAF